ncbi:MAG: Hpt domain-containing protein, partial [Planctomycetota bacterium]
MSSNDTPLAGEIETIRAMLLEGQSVAPELQEIFSEEAEDHLRSIYDGLDRLQVNGGDSVALADIRRSAHTLKGAAGAVGVQSVTRLSHRMEDLLDHLADNGKPSTSEMTLLFLSTTDRIQELTAESCDIDTMTTSIAQLFQQYEMLLPGAGQVAPPSSEAIVADLKDDALDFNDEDDPEMRAALAAFGVDFDDDDDDDDDEALLAQLDGTAASPTIENPSADAAPTEHVEPARLEDKPPKDEPATAAIKEQAQPAEQTANASLVGSKSESHIRVPLSRLDEMVRLVGEMIINRSAFAQRLGDFGSQIDDLQVALSRLRGVSDDIETRYSIEALKQGDLNRVGLTPEHSSGGNRWTSMLASPHSANGNEAHQEFDELEFDRYNEFHLLARTLSEATSD